MSNDFRFVDLFCGGGGSITGAINALRSAGVRYEGRGFNHWDLAIQTIQERYGERVASRLEEMCARIRLDGADRRRNHK